MEIKVYRGTRHWWAFSIRGLLFILVGIYMIASPASSYLALGFFFGLVIFLAGVAELFRVNRDRRTGNRGWHIVLGVIDMLLGIILMGHVTASVDILRIIVGIWFLFKGFSLLGFSRLTGMSWIFGLGGVLTVLFALLILFNPVFGAMTIILWTAIAFIITGFFNVLLGFWLKQFSG
jgi:uncharacterized membrane protein HdeD (DUF308 family)